MIKIVSRVSRDHIIMDHNYCIGTKVVTVATRRFQLNIDAQDQ